MLVVFKFVKYVRHALAFALGFVLFQSLTWAEALPENLKDVGIEDRLGAQVPIQELKFSDELGHLVPLSTYFKPEHPTLLALVYYECPNLCNLVLNGLVDGMKGLDWKVGEKYNIVTVSIDATEKFDFAARKKQAYLESLGNPAASDHWHFLTGDQANIDALAKSIGFKFKWDAKEQQFAHGAAIFVLTPEGKLSRTLYGIQFQPGTLKLALLEASHGKVGTIIDRILLFCYRYNSSTRTYSMVVTRLMQIGGALTVLVIGVFLGLFWRAQAKAKEGA